jgi:uncharacterized membrane protein YcaP (DUF421 family)
MCLAAVSRVSPQCFSITFAPDFVHRPVYSFNGKRLSPRVKNPDTVLFLHPAIAARRPKHDLILADFKLKRVASIQLELFAHGLGQDYPSGLIESQRGIHNAIHITISSGIYATIRQMVPGTHVLIEIVLRTAVIYVVVLLGVRLSGKREVGQMTPFDLTLLLLISNAVQNAMTGPDTSLIGGIAAAATLLILNYVVADVSGTNRRFRKLIEGQPSLLIHDGQIIMAHMAKEHISMDELERSLREHGVSSYKDVALGVLEVDGSISLLKYDELNPASHNHMVRRKYLQKKQ